jgi:RHS repeat-associated protein
MGCPRLTYYEKEESNFFRGLWKKSDGSKNGDNYYPFGLTFNSYKRENSVPNNYLFNKGSELQTDLNLGFYSTMFRTYDPAIGRFMQNDPLADFFTGISPYSFALDNPISYGDPDGLGPIDWLKRLINGFVGNGASRQARQAQRRAHANGVARSTGHPHGSPGKPPAPIDHPNTYGGMDIHIPEPPQLSIPTVSKGPRPPRNASTPSGNDIPFDHKPFGSNDYEFIDRDKTDEFLDPIAEALKENPQLTVVIQILTELDGEKLKRGSGSVQPNHGPHPNMQNSLILNRRAEAIRGALKSKGVDGDRIKTEIKTDIPGGSGKINLHFK